MMDSRRLSDVAPKARRGLQSIGTSLLVTGLAGAFCLLGCAGPQTTAAPEAQDPGAVNAEPSEHRLTYLMGHMLTFSNKLGWAIQAQNQPLAVFYLDKVDQVMDEITRIERWQGLPVGSMAKATMSGSLTALRSGVDAADWTVVDETYRGMTLACNSCHSASQRGYLVMTPVAGPAPQGQQFQAP